MTTPPPLQTYPLPTALTATAARSKCVCVHHQHKSKHHATVLSHARCDKLLLYLTYIPALCVFRQVDVNSKNVFGQPRLRASLRDLRSPRRSHKSTVEDDLKKLIIMDSPGEIPQRDMSPRRTLQRTFSDESLCSGRRDASYASTAPLFDQGTPSDLLFTSTLPTRRHAHSASHMPNKKGEWGHSLMSLPSHFPVSVPNYGMSRTHRAQL
ncbi:unnamed protein product [Oncorhynchus mykiss]|uniref:Signal-induced proliferation-associated 1-like protein C-terminal domain-containing protein n=1 Tax=Oncorhynchus mykiss TaxID=8022 RepID=A0A060YAW3_ONCMY|nr:unnamed protein product [Oncorhynchus mykiss]